MAWQKLEEQGRRARVVPGFIRYPLIALGLVLSFYFLFTFGGPYRWISELQARLFGGEYYIALSFFLTWMTFLIPTLIIVRALIPYYERRRMGRDDLLDQQ